MFVEGFKQGLRYTASIGERTFGLQTPRLALEHTLRTNNLDTHRIVDRVGLGLMAIDTSFVQLIAPSLTRIGSQVLMGNASESVARRLANLGLAAIALDTASAIAVISYSGLNQHNITEGVVIALAAHALTHIGLDVLEAGIKRIPRLRPPSPTTLAV